MLCQGSLLNIKTPDRTGMRHLTEAGPYAVSTVAGLASNVALCPLLVKALYLIPPPRAWCLSIHMWMCISHYVAC